MEGLLLIKIYATPYFVLNQRKQKQRFRLNYVSNLVILIEQFDLNFKLKNNNLIIHGQRIFIIL